jgi:hypothetical protein
MKLEDLKETKEPQTQLMVIMGPNPYGWRPRVNSHSVCDKLITPLSPISNDYQEMVLKDIMDDSKGG